MPNRRFGNLARHNWGKFRYKIEFSGAQLGQKVTWSTLGAHLGITWDKYSWDTLGANTAGAHLGQFTKTKLNTLEANTLGAHYLRDYAPSVPQVTFCPSCAPSVFMVPGTIDNTFL